jgi:hypothetical protein
MLAALKTRSRVQQDFRNHPAVPEYEGRLEAFQAAIDRIFADMDRGFSKPQTWEFANQREQMLLGTLVQFDAIFTLNQDLLFERFYVNDGAMLESKQRWNSVILPGVKDQRDARSRTISGSPDGRRFRRAISKSKIGVSPISSCMACGDGDDGTGQRASCPRVVSSRVRGPAAGRHTLDGHRLLVQ